MSCSASNVHSPMVAASNFACCAQSTYVQDQVCTQINITPVAPTTTTQDLYVIDINPAKLYVTGTLSISSAPVGSTLRVNYLLGSVLVETDTIIPGTALAFTKSGFDTIQLSYTTISGSATPNIVGELCLTIRYPVS